MIDSLGITKLAFPRDAMLTTIDNPWNPHTHLMEWNRWDEDHGYNTTNYLARLTNVDVLASDLDKDIARDLAMSYILDNDDLNIYKIVYEENIEADA